MTGVVVFYGARNSRMNGNEFHPSSKIPFDKLRNDKLLSL